MAAIEPRLRTAMTRQFSRRDAALARGAARVGWKLGAGNAERIGQGPVVGYLLSETLLAGGSSFQVDAEGGLHVDAEVAVSMAADIDDEATDSEVENSVGGVAVALEIVELNEGDAVEIVAANIFHRGVVFASERDRSALANDAVGAVEVNGGTAASAPLPDDLAHRLRMASRTLHAMHERLLPGDRVITGSIVQVPSARVRFALTR